MSDVKIGGDDDKNRRIGREKNSDVITHFSSVGHITNGCF